MCAQGTTLTKSDFASHAAMTSVGVSAPGMTTTSCWEANSITAGFETITSQKLRSGIETQLRDRWIRHSSRADNNTGNAFDQMGDDLDSVGHGQRDFDDDNPSSRDRLSGKQGGLRRVDANRSDNAGFLKPAPHLESLHLVVSFGARLAAADALVFRHCASSLSARFS